MLYLNRTFSALWSGQDPFDAAMGLTGDVYRSVDGRRTIRVTVDGANYFAKIHTGIGWLEILKNWLQLKQPTVSARFEWEAIQKLTDLGIDTMKAAAFGERGWNPATMHSFIITEALEDTESLEELFAASDGWRLPRGAKLALVKKLGVISRELHANGINHRDYYLCHFLLDRQSLAAGGGKIDPRLHLIDLHRAQIRVRTPERWRVKDVSGLFFSAIGDGLSPRDLFRFMKVYSGKTLRRTLKEDRAFWGKVYQRGYKMYVQEGLTPPPWITSLDGR